MRHGRDGHLLEIGARTRTIPPSLRRALRHRDRGCCFPGCGLPFGQGHHLRHWAQGGPTTLSNLALLCRRHHRAVHEEGFQVERLPDGELQFRYPNGRLLPEVPPSIVVRSDAGDALRAQHEADGIHIDARTGMSGWLGEPLDVGWAIDVLHPLATNELASNEMSPMARLPELDGDDEVDLGDVDDKRGGAGAGEKRAGPGRRFAAPAARVLGSTAWRPTSPSRRGTS
jgi:HNH endonuclease